MICFSSIHIKMVMLFLIQSIIVISILPLNLGLENTLQSLYDTTLLKRKKRLEAKH